MNVLVTYVDLPNTPYPPRILTPAQLELTLSDKAPLITHPSAT